jgi:hypothetical protein
VLWIRHVSASVGEHPSAQLSRLRGITEVRIRYRGCSGQPFVIAVVLVVSDISAPEAFRADQDQYLVWYAFKLDLYVRFRDANEMIARGTPCR